MKKAKCIIHFTNYLMEDTTRTNTLSLDKLHAGFQLMTFWQGGRAAKLPTPPAGDTTW